MNKELIIFLKELLQASDQKDKCDICIKNKTLKEILNYIDNSISKEVIKDKQINFQNEYKIKRKRIRELENTIGMNLEEYEELKRLWAEVSDMDFAYGILQELLEEKHDK